MSVPASLTVSDLCLSFVLPVPMVVCKECLVNLGETSLARALPILNATRPCVSSVCVCTFECVDTNTMRVHVRTSVCVCVCVCVFHGVSNRERYIWTD